MRVLVTGADGFLGSNLVRGLLERGHAVRAFLQPGRATGTLDGLELEEARGDLLDVQGLSRAMRGCDAVVHAAASTAVWPRHHPSLARVNVGGTAAALQAALEAGVERFVHVGSASSFGPGSKADPGTEERPYGGARYGLGYMDTKRRAHELVIQAWRRRDLPALVVAPTFMLGPYDSAPGSGRMILAVHRGAPAAAAPGGRNYVAVKDVASALCSALQRGSPGESYIAGHENLSYLEAFTLIARTVGARTPRLVLPCPAVACVGALGSLQGTLLRREPLLTYPMARIACHGHYYSAAKAVRELGLPQTPIRTAVAEAFAWFEANGYLDRRRNGR